MGAGINGNRLNGHMKTKKAFEKWIREQVNFYTPILALSLWTIRIEPDEKEGYLAITCNYPYLDATIKYSTKAHTAWVSGGMKRDRILHEMCHLITDPLYIKAIERYSSREEIKDEREKLTDTISSIITKLLNY